MIIYENGEEWFIDVERLQADLALDLYKLHCISQTGEMVVDEHDDRGRFVNREVWQARPTGYPNPWKLAGMDFEFCRSVPMADAIS